MTPGHKAKQLTSPSRRRTRLAQSWLRSMKYPADYTGADTIRSKTRKMRTRLLNSHAD